MNSTNKLSVPQSIPYVGQVDNLPTESQPDPTETLDVGPPPTSLANITPNPYLRSVSGSQFDWVNLDRVDFDRGWIL